MPSFSRDSPKTLMNSRWFTCISSNITITATGSTSAISEPKSNFKTNISDKLKSHQIQQSHAHGEKPCLGNGPQREANGQNVPCGAKKGKSKARAKVIKECAGRHIVTFWGKTITRFSHSRKDRHQRRVAATSIGCRMLLWINFDTQCLHLQECLGTQIELGAGNAQLAECNSNTEADQNQQR